MSDDEPEDYVTHDKTPFLWMCPECGRKQECGPCARCGSPEDYGPPKHPRDLQCTLNRIERKLDAVLAKPTVTGSQPKRIFQHTPETIDGCDTRTPKEQG